MPTGAGRSARRRLAYAGSVLAMVGGLSSCSGSSSHPAAIEPSYGGLPNFLPKSAIDPDSVLIGTAAKPALTTEGDAVDVRLTGGSVRATVSGPEVPGEGLPYEPESTTCTWKITLTAATAPVPIRPADFTSIDHLGHVFRPALVKGQPVPPAELAPGKTVTFELRTMEAVGEGLMRWAPEGKILASWDFTVEND
jgi:hypothetical protein